MNKTLLNSSIRVAGKYALCTLFLAIGFVSITHAQVSLVKDINWYNTDAYASDFRNMIRYQGKLYFIFRDQIWVSDGTVEGTKEFKSFNSVGNLRVCGSYVFFSAIGEESESGNELWRTDGTLEGTVMVKDIYPGIENSNPTQLTNVNGTLYFTANDGARGIELWKSDGTAAGTTIVRDILRIVGSSNPQNFVLVGNVLFFRANDGMHGYELWRTDGTPIGTYMAADINPADRKSGHPEQIANVNGTLFFFANDGSGKQLWKYVVSQATLSVVKKIQASGTPHLDHLRAINNLVCFQANDGIHGTEIWRSDGTEAGTYLLEDLTPGPGSESGYATPHLNYFIVSNGLLYFITFGEGNELWSTDGTTAQRLTTYHEAYFPWTSPNIAGFNGYSYFMADHPEGYGLTLFKTDGTAAGTQIVKTGVGEGYDSNPMFTELNGSFCFIGKAELWKTDGTEGGTSIIRPIGSPIHSFPQELTDVNGTLFFEATDNGYNRSLWKSDGTSGGTISLKPYLNTAEHITNINGTAYFAGEDFHGAEVWTSDGTAAGTNILKNINPEINYASMGSDPSEFTELNGTILFNAHLTGRPGDLWKTDGTDAGTEMVDYSDPSMHQFANPRQLIRSGNKVFFVADGQLGAELWVTDGTKEGTSMPRDIRIHYRGSHPIMLTAFNNKVFFYADNGGNGYELWRSDGTPAGTVIVKDFRTLDLGSGDQLAPIDLGNMHVMNGSLYLTALRSTGINALWKSDGTGAGTRVVKEFAGQPTAEILGSIGNYLYYVLGYANYIEVWKSDGTATGTTKVKTINSFNGVKPFENAITPDAIYFIATNIFEHKIYRTNGTDAGTYQINFTGTPYELEVSGDKIYLSAYTEIYGVELYTVDEPVSSSRLAVASVEEAKPEFTIEDSEASVRPYPNPFSSSFSIRVNGNESEAYRLEVIGLNGNTVEQKELAYNAEHAIGQNWASGFYVLKIDTGKGVITRKVLKSNE